MYCGLVQIGWSLTLSLDDLWRPSRRGSWWCVNLPGGPQLPPWSLGSHRTPPKSLSLSLSLSSSLLFNGSTKNQCALNTMKKILHTGDHAAFWGVQIVAPIPEISHKNISFDDHIFFLLYFLALWPKNLFSWFCLCCHRCCLCCHCCFQGYRCCWRRYLCCSCSFD